MHTLQPVRKISTLPKVHLLLAWDLPDLNSACLRAVELLKQQEVQDPIGKVHPEFGHTLHYKQIDTTLLEMSQQGNANYVATLNPYVVDSMWFRSGVELKARVMFFRDGVLWKLPTNFVVSFLGDVRRWGLLDALAEHSIW